MPGDRRDTNAGRAPGVGKVLRHEALERLAVAGDRGALNDLLISHFDRVHAFISRRRPFVLYGVLETDDILQETLVRVIRGIGTFDPTRENSFEAWLLTIASHTIQSLVVAVKAQKRGGRFRRRRQSPSPASSQADLVDLLFTKEGTGSGVAATNEALLAMQRQIANLPAEYRQAVQLRLLQGQSLDETAQVLGYSPAAVRGVLYRAKLRLREAMGRSSRWFGR